MNFEEYSAHDGIALAKLVAEKKVKASELVELAIARANEVNPKLNAIVFEDYVRARVTAADKTSNGAFGGVPFFLKDIFALAEGMPTRQGCAFFPPIKSDHDSLLTSRFKSAGLIPLGKTNVPELGLVPTTESRLYGAARNPWDLSRSTGGSSGGSAAAVAAGIVPLAHAMTEAGRSEFRPPVADLSVSSLHAGESALRRTSQRSSTGSQPILWFRAAFATAPPRSMRLPAASPATPTGLRPRPIPISKQSSENLPD